MKEVVFISEDGLSLLCTNKQHPDLSGLTQEKAIAYFSQLCNMPCVSVDAHCLL